MLWTACAICYNPAMEDASSSTRTGSEPQGVVAGHARPTGRGDGSEPGTGEGPGGRGGDPVNPGWVIETVFSPFHCLYQDALSFHTQSRLARSDADASRLARAALLLYISAAEALVHQAAEELGRHELRSLIADPSRPLPLEEACRLLPAIAAEPGTPTGPFDHEAAPVAPVHRAAELRNSWAYPGASPSRRAYYRSPRRDGDYEPLQPHQVPDGCSGPSRPIDWPSPAPGCRATRMPCGPGTWTRRAASSTRRSRPSTAGWAAP